MVPYPKTRQLVKCDNCGKEFAIYPSTIKKGFASHCCNIICRRQYFLRPKHHTVDSNGIASKQCVLCHQVKPLQAFWKNPSLQGGYQSACIVCTSARLRKYYQEHKEERRAKSRVWRIQNIELIRSRQKQHRNQIKERIIQAYGAACTCCGETDIAFLTLEHLNHDGRQHRKAANGNLDIYLDVIKQGFPKDRYTIFCMNCNFATRFGAVCPHKLPTEEPK